MTTTGDRIALPVEFQARTEFLVLTRLHPDHAWSLPDHSTVYPDREAADRAVAFNRRSNAINIEKFSGDKATEGLDLTTPSGHKTATTRLALVHYAQSVQYLIVCRDVPAFTPVN